MKCRNINVPELDAELVSMFLDPRFKALDADDCGGVGLSKKVMEKLESVRDGFKDGNDAFTSPPSPAAPVALTPAKRSAESDDSLVKFSKKREKRTAAAAAAQKTDFSMACRFDKELEEYKLLPEILAGKFDLVGFWAAESKPRLDDDGNVRELAKFPILSMIARAFHSADTTSCQSERDFSALAVCMSNVRQSMIQDRVGMMMFLRLNSGVIPEMVWYNENMAKLKKAQSDGHVKAVKAQAAGAGEVVEIE